MYFMYLLAIYQGPPFYAEIPGMHANLVPLGFQAVTDEMGVKEPKVTKASQERLEPRGLQALAETRVLKERMVLKENAEPRVPRDKRGSGEREDHVESLGLQD